MKMTTKMWGLERLRSITGGMAGCSAIPTYIFNGPDEITKPNLPKRTRFLIRMDETGKRYDTLEWHEMPRSDVSSRFSEKSLRERVQTHWNKINPKLRSRARILLHPTYPRNHVKWAGRIVYSPEDNAANYRIEVKLNYQPAPENQRLWSFHIEYRLTIKDGKMAFAPITKPRSITLPRNPELRSIFTTVAKFVDRARRDPEVRGDPGWNEHFIDAHFVTYKHKPGHLEFYDLRPSRS